MIQDNIAFMALEPSGDGYVGAILVTDGQGIPQEFRCTHCVKPSLTHRQLYGGTLIPHIGIELCGQPLLKEIRNKIALILVKDSYMLQLRESQTSPIVLLTKSSGIIDAIDSKIQSAKLESAEGEFEPIVVRPHSSHNEDLDESLKILHELRFDPLEPFSRIQIAVRSLAEADPKYR